MQTILNSIDFTLNILNSVTVTFFRILITYLCIDKQVCGMYVELPKKNDKNT